MPCVCLSNTFKQWQTFKSLKSRRIKSAPVILQPLMPESAPATRLTEDEIVRVPHARVKICQRQALGGAPIVQDFASEIISMSPQPEIASAHRTVKLQTAPTQSASAVAESPRHPKAATRLASRLKNKLGSASPAAKARAKSSIKARKLSANPARSTVQMTRADLINAESKLGSALFGPIPEGHRREFFHDQNNIWIWHEDWQDGQQNSRQMTVRYEVRTSGVYKKVSAGKYFKLEGDELENFRKATHAYLFMIKKYLYNHQPTSAKAA